MDDLISRQAAITEFSCCKLTPDGGIDAYYAIDFLEQMPSAQPEIIRCKDCKDYDIINQPYDEGFCRKLNYSVDKDSFCSYGERRTDETD